MTRRRGRRDTIAVQHHEAAVAHVPCGFWGFFRRPATARRRDGGREQPARLEVGHDVLVNRGHDDALQAVCYNVGADPLLPCPTPATARERRELVEHRAFRQQPSDLSARLGTRGEPWKLRLSSSSSDTAHASRRDGISRAELFLKRRGNDVRIVQ